MPSKTKTSLAALFILGPVSMVVLAGPNNRIDDRGSVRGFGAHVHRSHRRRQSCRDGTHECVSSLRSLLNIGINTARARSSAPQVDDGADAFRVYC